MAKQFISDSLKVVSNSCQIDFLLKLKCQNLLPKSLYTLKFPSFSDTPTQLKNHKYIVEYQQHALRLMISNKYSALNNAKRLLHENSELIRNLSPRDSRAINRIKARYTQQVRDYYTDTHSRKYSHIVDFYGQQSSDQQPDNSDVIVYTARIFGNDALSVLGKGPKFTPSPTNIPKLKRELEVSMAHLAHRLRCDDRREQALKPSPAPTTPHAGTPSFNTVLNSCYRKSVLEEFANNAPLEHSISSLRHAVNFHARDLKSHLGTPNLTVNEQKSLSSLKGHVITPTDKTNKLTIFDESFVATKLEQSVSDTRLYESLNSDPTKNIEEQANLLWSEISCECLSIEPEQINDFIKRHSQAPSLKVLMKDHKPDFPNCKVRTIQPVRGSAIENFDILLGMIFGQSRPFRSFKDLM